MQRLRASFLTRILIAALVTLALVSASGTAAMQDAMHSNGSAALQTNDDDDSGITRTPRTGSDAEEPEPTEDDDTEITRTPRTGNTTDEDAEEPQDDVTSQPAGSYTGPTYGYSLEYDPEVWTLDAEIQEGRVDGIRLVRDNSTYTIWAWDAYGSDPLACLEGEVEYYSTQHEAISNWEPVLDASGDPLRHESESLAWGVYHLDYESSNGATSALIDYISCEPIPGQDAVLIVLLSSDPDAYNTELDHALDVLDTLQFSDATNTAGEDETIDATVDPDETIDTTGVEISTNLSGSEYTSPTYGFTAQIPLEWQILDESIEGTDEVLVVGNGTSVVTLWATDQYAGDLAGCVDFAAASSGLNLQLDSDAAGGDFRGVYRNEAFGNFVYEQDGVQMMYFINCQAIPGTNGFLILIQDVEYDQFTSERRFRSEIENSIVMP